MPVVNPLSHPQVLFLGFAPEDPRLERMQRRVATHRVLSSPEEIQQLRLADWDALVMEGGSVPYQASKIHVLAIGCQSLGQASSMWSTVTYSGAQRSHVLHITDDTSPDLRRLLNAEAIPWINSQDDVPYLQISVSGSGIVNPGARDIREGQLSGWAAIVTDADRNVVIGGFPRAADGKWVWAIPYRSPHPELWLDLAMAHWRTVDAERFPEIPQWRTRETWMTAAEREAQRQLAEAREEFDVAQEAFRKLEVELESAVLDAEKSAEKAERRLLTEQGEPLVEAVSHALNKLGFTIRDIDEERAARGLAKVEDLHVTCPDQPAVRIMAEVKGYARGGAKASDLIQMSQHAIRFLQREGTAPDRSWYVVNQFATTDPDTRQSALAGAPEDLAAFANGGGLIIDTRELFRLTTLVSEGRLQPRQARAALIDQQGLFDHSSATQLEGPIGGEVSPS